MLREIRFVDIFVARHLAGCREGILPSPVGARTPHNSRRDGGATGMERMPTEVRQFC